MIFVVIRGHADDLRRGLQLHGEGGGGGGEGARGTLHLWHTHSHHTNFSQVFMYLYHA